MDIKSQYSMEFMLVFAFSLLIIIPLVSLMNSEYQKNKEHLDQSQADRVLDEIYMATQNTYYAGYPSRTTLELYMPRGISLINRTIVNPSGNVKSELVFELKSSGNTNTLVRVFPFRIEEDLSEEEGKRKILIKAEEGDYVNITDFPGN